MTDSIENLWRKNMNAHEDTLTVRINDLYGRKSTNIVDKLMRMYDINVKALIIGCPIVIAGTALAGVPWLGLWICLLLTPIIIGGRKSLGELRKLDKTMNSYDYLRAFAGWRDTMLARFSGIYRAFYPLFFLGFVVQGWFSEDGQKVIGHLAEASESTLIAGAPIWLWGVIAGATAVIALLSPAIYKLDIYLVYGAEFKRLDETLGDMEALQNGAAA